MPVIDKDMGWNDLAAKLKDMIGDPHVLVGVQGGEADATHEGGDDKEPVTNADVASWNEFGTPTIPARSFIRATVDIYEQKLQQRAVLLGRGVLFEAFTPNQALGLLGEEARGLMIERINAHIDPPNAPSTIARKGSSTPLIAHTGALKNSITLKVDG
jgi:hypothetical protein